MLTACCWLSLTNCVFFFQAEDGIRDLTVTGVQTCALPISDGARKPPDRVFGLGGGDPPRAPVGARRVVIPAFRGSGQILSHPRLEIAAIGFEIGRASCRERV